LNIHIAVIFADKDVTILIWCVLMIIRLNCVTTCDNVFYLSTLRIVVDDMKSRHDFMISAILLTGIPQVKRTSTRALLGD